MTKKKSTVRGYVVDHKESKVRYAVSPENLNPKVHTKVRPLKSHETVLGYVPKPAPSGKASESAADQGGLVSDDAPQTPSTEGNPTK